MFRLLFVYFPVTFWFSPLSCLSVRL